MKVSLVKRLLNEDLPSPSALTKRLLDELIKSCELVNATPPLY
jgi:hypothetical protein